MGKIKIGEQKLTPLLTGNTNLTNYPLEIKNAITLINVEKNEFLRYHQLIIKQLYTRAKINRGILINHGLGQGKTILAASIANYYREIEPSRNIVILLTKSLETNFRDNIKMYLNGLKLQKKTDISEEQIIEALDDFRYVSLNASNMFKQILKSRKNKSDIKLEKKLGRFIQDTENFNVLENSLLIIDEAHNLFNSITNGSKNAVQLYDLIMATRNIKLIFLSGTPIINDPFELVPCFNMLKGFQQVGKSGQRHTLFSENIEEFNDLFVDVESKSIKNKNKFMNRIYGLVSYFGDAYFDSDKTKPGFPTKLTTIVEKIPMSNLQYAAYDIARDAEIDEAKSASKRKAKGRFASKGNSSTTYRVKSRQISNFVIPEYALGPRNGKKARKKFLHKIKDSDWTSNKLSPKFAKILSNIKKHGDGLALVYSEFVSGEGLGAFALYLEHHGYDEFQFGDSQEKAFGLKPTNKKKKYAIISGNVPVDIRKKIVAEFNKKENKNGKIIHVLLISSTGVEGLSTKRVRSEHTMEPYWNYARIDQFEGRGVRFNSHIDMPKNEQTVQPYVYLSDYPKGIPESRIKEMTTDIDIYTRAVQQKRIIDTFSSSLVNASIDCTAHYTSLSDKVKKQINCKICKPSGQLRFHPLLSTDMKMPDPCEEISTTKVRVLEIKDNDGNQYHYKVNDKNTLDIDLYIYDDAIKGHKIMQPSHKSYGFLMQKIIDKLS